MGELRHCYCCTLRSLNPWKFSWSVRVIVFNEGNWELNILAWLIGVSGDTLSSRKPNGLFEKSCNCIFPVMTIGKVDEACILDELCNSLGSGQVQALDWDNAGKEKLIGETPQDQHILQVDLLIQR